MWNLFLALSYVIVGWFFVRFGPWGAEVESLRFRMRIDHTDLSFIPRAGLGWLEAEGAVRAPAWKLKLVSVLLWTSAVALWPLGLLAVGSKWLREPRDRKTSRGRRWKLRGRVSTCTKQLTFSCVTGSRTTGTIYFSAEDCEGALVASLNDAHHSPDEEGGQLLDWIRHYDRADESLTAFADYWQYFRLPVAELVRGKRCLVACHQCARVYQAADIRVEKWKAFVRPRGAFRGGGRGGHLLKCPEDHVVLETVTIIA